MNVTALSVRGVVDVFEKKASHLGDRVGALPPSVFERPVVGTGPSSQ